MYAEQTSYFNQKLKEAQEAHHADRLAMQKAMNEENILRAKQKRDMEQKEKNDLLGMEQNELHYTLTDKFMTEDPSTEQSQLAAHRVKPYHFKGFSEQQKQAVLHERNQQLKEMEMEKKRKEEEERLWAL